jgi:hypothetical protein
MLEPINVYIVAKRKQYNMDDKANALLNVIMADHSSCGLRNPLSDALDTLVQDALGMETFDWIEWWMYETDFGCKNMTYTVAGVDYDPTQQSFQEFFQTITTS